MNHKEWVNNEYNQWVKALEESTVNNFKSHPIVDRMLGNPDARYWDDAVEFEMMERHARLIYEISQIGGLTNPMRTKRMIYYAIEVVFEMPTSIIEIGGGVGEFYAILRALDYKGDYYILDIPGVQRFQGLYLAEVETRTGLNMTQSWKEPEIVISFYALGEFDDETKESYRSLISSIPHGYIAWNPHSGATDDLTLFKHDIKVSPGMEPGVKIIQW